MNEKRKMCKKGTCKREEGLREIRYVVKEKQENNMKALNSKTFCRDLETIILCPKISQKEE